MTSANGCGFWLVGGVLGVVIDPNEMSGAISGIKCTKNSDVSDWEWLWVWFFWHALSSGTVAIRESGCGLAV